MFYVTAHHRTRAWSLVAQHFALATDGATFGQSHYVCKDARNGFYAFAPLFGCGPSMESPEKAIAALLKENGCDGAPFIASVPHQRTPAVLCEKPIPAAKHILMVKEVAAYRTAVISCLLTLGLAAIPFAHFAGVL